MLGIGLGLGRRVGFVKSYAPAALFAPGDEGDYWEAFRLTGADDTPIETLAGRRGEHDFTQSTESNRPLVKTRADGVRYLDFASAKSMSVAASTASFKYLHDGTGGQVVALIEYPQSEVTSNFIRSATGTANNGFIIAKSASSQNAIATITRSASGSPAASDTISELQVSPSERLVMLAVSYKHDGGSSDLLAGYDSCRDQWGVATSNAPNAGDAAQNLTIESTFGGRLYALLAINRRLSQVELKGLYDYWRSKVEYQVPTPDLTLLVGGQSNPSGRGTLYPTTIAAQPGVYMLDKAEEYRLLFEPSHSIVNRPVATSPDEAGVATPQFSFLLTAGKALKDDASINTLWVPCAIGSTSIAQWDVPADVGDRTKLFGAAHYRMTKALSDKGGSPVIVWYGQEASRGQAVADYTNGGVGTGYQTQWDSLVANLRAEIADAPIVFCQLAADDTEADSIANAVAGEAQRQFELTDDDAIMVVTHDLERNASTDDIHLSENGQEALGERISLAIRDHVLSGLGPELVANGQFNADKNYTLTSGWSISGGALVGSGVTVGNEISQNIGAEDGATYLCTFTVEDYTGGGVSVGLPGINGAVRSANGTYTEQLVSAGVGNVRISRRTSDFTGKVTNLSVRKVLNASGSLENIDGKGPRIVDATYSGSTVTLELTRAVDASATDYDDMFRVWDNGVEATVTGASRNGGDASKIDITCSSPLTGPVTLAYGHKAGAASAARTDIVVDADSGLPLPLFGPILVAAV